MACLKEARAVRKDIYDLIIAPHGLGDLVMLCRALDGYHIGARLLFLVTDRPSATFLRATYAAQHVEIFCIDEMSGGRVRKFLRLIAVLRRYRIRNCFSQVGVQPKLYAALARLSGAASVYGWAAARPWRVNVVQPDPARPHKVDHFGTMLQAAGLAAAAGQPDFRLPTPAIPSGLSRPPGLVIAPTSSVEEAHKRWPEAHFSKFIAAIARDYDGGIALVGTAAERDICDRIIRGSGVEALNLCGALSIDGLVAVIHGADLTLANCNATSHIAAYLGRPVIGIYGPTDPTITGVYGDDSVVVQTSLFCAPCYGEMRYGCGRPVCMLGIDVEDVVMPARKILARAQPA